VSEGGTLIGVGVGPGDPELLTLKAIRVLKEVEVIAHFAKAGNASNARATIVGHIRPDMTELTFRYPVTTEIPRNTRDYCDRMRTFYDDSAATVAAHLDAGHRVAVICEGDPLFYGSYMHLHVRLAARYPTEVVAGVTGMSGCWSAVATPIAQGNDVFTVLPGTLSENELERRLEDANCAVIMKLGRNLPKVRRALRRAGRLDRAIYVERGTTANAASMRLTAKMDDEAPYLSMVLVPGWEERV
jgi:precorrin-2/cobalt-factor-2 C20-methyltransferase